MAAAFALGAEGVQIGTRFMCAEECTIHPDVKAQVIKAKDRDTVVTGRSTGHPVRVIKNKLARQMRRSTAENKPEEIEALGSGKLAAAMRDGDTDMGSSWPGRPPRWCARSSRRPRSSARSSLKPECDVEARSDLRAKGRRVTVRTALVFPGQGSQRTGMLDHVPELESLNRLLDAAEALSDLELSTIAQLGTPEDLADTRVAQPLLYLADWAWGVTLLQSGVGPVAVAGHSLGELAALAVAGVFSPEAGLELVVERSKVMAATAASTPGGMSAVLGMERATIAELLADMPGAWVANDNAPGQVVISGTRSGIEQATEALLEAGARKVVPLAVAGPFHSPLMEPARAAFEEILLGAEFADARIPVLQNTDPTPATDARAHSRAPDRADHVAGPLDRNDGRAGEGGPRHPHRGGPRIGTLRARQARGRHYRACGRIDRLGNTRSGGVVAACQISRARSHSLPERRAASAHRSRSFSRRAVRRSP